MAAKFELFKTSNGQFMFNLLSTGNHKIVLTCSETYTTKQSAQKGIESVKKNGPLDQRYERYTGKDGKFRFRLKAGNGEIIGKGEGYNTEAACNEGIEWVKKNAPGASTEERS